MTVEQTTIEQRNAYAADLRLALQTSTLPEGLIEGVVNYVGHRYEPGSFLTAVLSNDLQTACATADCNNGPQLQNIVKALYNTIPSRCWGSAERVSQWLGGA